MAAREGPEKAVGQGWAWPGPWTAQQSSATPGSAGMVPTCVRGLWRGWKELTWHLGEQGGWSGEQVSWSLKIGLAVPTLSYTNWTGLK